jgi:hypothetical protein
MDNVNDVSVTVWWTPACGAMHVEENPVSIGPECPDGLKADWWQTDAD